MTVETILPILVIVFVLATVLKGIRVVPQARVAIIERLGKYHRTLDPGPHLIIPWLDRVKDEIDMREQVVAFQPQPVITKDNVTISIDTVLYYTVTDPFKAIYEVANMIVAAEQLTITTLRNVIGSLSLDDALTSRDKINADLRVVLDEATHKWGIRVNRIEVKSIDPPRGIQEAMEKQMRAERDRRAAILEAEGQKQSQILTAEGDRQSQILRAQGDKDAAILRAQGEGQAIQTVFDAIHAGNPTPDLLNYQYLSNTLPAVANGTATKMLLVPNEAMAGGLGMAAPFGALFGEGQQISESGGGSGEAR
jgi:regulator of protease activity HflC (stomatin/prohibitin superfamily)